MTQLVWYYVEADEIFIDLRFDCLFYSLSGAAKWWEKFELLGEL